MGSCRHCSSLHCTEGSESRHLPTGANVNCCNMLVILVVLLYGTNESSHWAEAIKSNTPPHGQELGRSDSYIKWSYLVTQLQHEIVGVFVLHNFKIHWTELLFPHSKVVWQILSANICASQLSLQIHVVTTFLKITCTSIIVANSLNIYSCSVKFKSYVLLAFLKVICKFGS